MVQRRHLGVDIETMMSREGKLCDEYPINNAIMKSMVIGINIVWKYVYLIT
jgi:hypothetical protein